MWVIGSEENKLSNVITYEISTNLLKVRTSRGGEEEKGGAFLIKADISENFDKVPQFNCKLNDHWVSNEL